MSEITFEVEQYGRKGPCGGSRYCEHLINMIEYSIPDDTGISLKVTVPLTTGETREDILCTGFTKTATVREVVRVARYLYYTEFNSHENKKNLDDLIGHFERIRYKTLV